MSIELTMSKTLHSSGVQGFGSIRYGNAAKIFTHTLYPYNLIKLQFHDNIVLYTY